MSEPRLLRLEGDGPPLAVDVHDVAERKGAAICVHGFGSGRKSSKNAALAARLTALGFTVLAPDLQGHGDSGGDFEHLTVARSICDVRRVAARPEYADAPVRVLVGSSFGGLVGAWAAAEDQDLCDGLVLIAPALGYLDRYLPGLPEEERSAWEAGRPHVIRLDDREVRLAPDILHERADRSTARLAAALRTPTLVVHGTADESVPVEASHDLVARMPSARIEMRALDGADHRLSRHLNDLVTATERFVRAIAASPGERET